ncbi:MAG TPA: PEGA domain-containing protein [Patescibacteria group bacterium]|nr:PEGA domain-containing protein [Patescibacteria group bacterium]
MTLRNRFLLVGFGILIFVVIVPLLVLFTIGYEIDWTHHKIVKTGVLIVQTMPDKADIYLNNQKAQGLTPETVRFVLPGDYNVRIEKTGYQSWTKRLSVDPQLATWVNFDRDFITLFLAEPQQQIEMSDNFSSLSDNGTEIAYIQNNNLHIYDVGSQSTQQLGNIGNFYVPLTFTENLRWSNAAKVLSYFQSHSFSVPDISSISQVQTDGDNFAILAARQLQVLSANDPQTVDTNVSGFSMDGENLWYVQGQLLKEYNLRTKVTTTIYTNLPTSQNAQIIRGEGNTFLLLDKSLYKLNDSLEKIYDGATAASYDTASHELLFADANDILLYDPQQKKTELILRSISTLNHPVINSYDGYVFFENENAIKAVELDGRDHRNIYTILTNVGPNSQFTLNSNGSVLTVFDDMHLASYKIR